MSRKRESQGVSDEKLLKAVAALEHALAFETKGSADPFYYAGIAKSFEMCFEYAWKYFKRHATEEGLDVFSPREAIKAAGKLGLISDVETWLGFLEDRNLAVHDYLGIADAEYLTAIKRFLKAAKLL